MLVRVLDGIDAFLDQLTSVHPLPLFLAVLAQLGKLSCTSMAWRNVLAAAYPDVRVKRRSILGAYLAGVGVNAIIPLRAGDAVRVVLAHRAVAVEHVHHHRLEHVRPLDLRPHRGLERPRCGRR